MTSAARTFASISSVTPPPGAPARLGRAVVLGGSVAGLLAARVLAEHADRVVVIERDPATDHPGARRGVPQSSQVHALLRGGAVQLERWFPGFADRAVAAGAQRVPADRLAIYTDGVAAPGNSDLLTSTRPFLEHQVRELVRGLPGVELVTGRVTGLDLGGDAVTGVRYEADGAPRHLAADLVVDASGRASRVSDWLSAAGWNAPPLTRQVTGINYATAFFRRPPGEQDVSAAVALVTPETGGDLGGATFTPVEEDRWIVLLAGFGECRPGRTAEDMVRRCRQEFPEPFGRVASGELLGDVATYRQGDSRRRDWAAAARLPAGLLAVGDAVASFNPIYGQGMTSAALHASCLSRWLRSGADLGAPARAFFALQKVVVDAAWDLSSGGDRSRPSVNRPPRGLERVTAGLIDLVVDATVVDPVVARAFDGVTQMVEHPQTLASPGILWRSLRARRTPRPQPTPALEPADRPA
ncbi:NAD(P)/FAD-dependent oxidoreductase [Kineococcus rubinsiae]|uniref:NAD(P)/FAD-dependent oxidoreductase n=1 Tax=Kineococcus rubinsiae TaxID=2609562 RepID=UPI001431CB71|nr:FAD-dependent monooxygenase [Kineococcus rubinsiae]NIZ90209.1 FAD-dependent oxidoreductase [Kineococcus rubinsiae]